MIKMILCGAKGRMGQEILRLAEDNKHLKVVAEIDSAFSGKEKGKYKNLKDLKVLAADVVVDFTKASEFANILSWCVNSKTALVSGTTGITDKDKNLMKAAAKKIRVFWSPNMSVGVNFILGLLSRYTKISDYDFEIVETHHNQKKDRPSGTALLLRGELEKAIGRKIDEPRSLRIGGVFGNHQILAGNQSEEIILEHRALNREVFARGALAAAEWLVDLPDGLYNMKDLVGEG